MSLLKSSSVTLHFLPAKAIKPGLTIAIENDDGSVVTGEVSNVHVGGESPDSPTDFAILINNDEHFKVMDADDPVKLIVPYLAGVDLTILQRAALSLLNDINVAGGLYERNGSFDTVEGWDEDGWPDLAESAVQTYHALKNEGVLDACLVITEVSDDDDDDVG